MSALLDLAKAALAASQAQVAEDPRFRAALDLVKRSELKSAAAELAGLDDPGLVLATMFLERFAVANGCESAAALSESLLRQVKSGALDHGWIARRFESAWSTEVAGHVPESRVEKRGEQGGFASFGLLKAVQALLDAGDVSRAREHLTQFGWYDKVHAGQAYALVGVAAADAKLLEEAVKVARKSPMIQDGGEEAEALGEVLRAFAEGGVAADHPAVVTCIKALLKLGNKPVRKDVRSYGLRIGALAAAKRGGEWSDHARTLLPRVWSDWLKAATQLVLASQNPADEAELLEAVALESDVAEFYPDHLDDLVEFVSTQRGPLDRARLLRKHGRPVGDLVDQAVSKVGGAWNGVERLWGQVLLADEDKARELFEGFGERNHPEVALRSAAMSLAEAGELERAAAYFEQALAAGFVPRYGGTASLMLQVPRLIAPAAEAAMEVRDRAERMESLSLLAQLRIELGDWEAAADLVSIAIAGPSGEEEPDWRPWSMRGDRSEWTPVRAVNVPTTTELRGADALEEVTALDRNEHLHAYWMLAHEIQRGALPALRKLMSKAPGGRGDSAQMKRAKLVEVSLIQDDIDTALVDAQAMSDCRYSGWGPAYTAETLAAWFALHPDALTLERGMAVLDVMQAAIPQDIPHTLATVVEHLAPLLPPPEQPGFFDRVRKFRNKFRRPQDAIAVDAIVAMGQARCGLVTAPKSMATAIDTVAAGAYTGPVFYLRLLRAAGMLNDVALTTAVVTMSTTGRVYQQCMNLERAMRIFWDAEVESPIPALLRAGAFATEVADQTRRSIVVMAPEFASDPVDAVLAVWLDEPPNFDQAIEQVRALADALRKVGRGDESDALQAQLVL